jgi:DNA adenine methylase
MAELARTIKGRMVISVGDCREMREAFKGLSISEVAINYTIGKTAPKKAVELIIKNW